jgi:hypothetical protein
MIVLTQTQLLTSETHSEKKNNFYAGKKFTLKCTGKQWHCVLILISCSSGGSGSGSAIQQASIFK